MAAQIGDVAPTLWGMIQWRSHYDNVTHDTSTGFMGWGCADGQAANVRRGMNACRAELAARPGRAQWLRRFGSAPLSKSSKSSKPVTPQLQASTPACAALAANEKRLNAVLAQQVDWELPPFPLPNGPLFAVSRSLGGLLSDDLDTPLVGSRAWVESLERTPLASRYWRSKEAGGRAIPEMAKRRCWPNSDSSLGLFGGACDDPGGGQRDDGQHAARRAALPDAGLLGRAVVLEPLDRRARRQRPLRACGASPRAG